jgi:hypothetical protein
MKKPLCESQHLGYAKDLGNGRAIYSKWPEKKKFVYRVWNKEYKVYFTIDGSRPSEWTNRKKVFNIINDYLFNQRRYEIHKFQVTEQRIS